jgi:hypothetical protein
MYDQERSMIEGLFQRLAQAETQAGPRDPQADSLIQGLVSRQPGAPYLMAQVVLMQEQGLANLQNRITELEQELAARAQAPAQSSGFLGGLFGGSKPQPAAAPVARAMPPQPASGGGWGNSPAQGMGMQPGMRPGMQPGTQGGGFRAGAMQTARGVAGGMLLATAVSGMFGSEAQASAAPAETPAAAPAPEPEAQEASGGEEDGGLFGGFFGGGEEDEF